MTINERIKRIRTDLKLSQNSFADCIGLKHGAISKMEKDGATVTDQNKRIICDKFHVSMRWLETGDGDMLSDNPAALVEKLAADIGMTRDEQELLETFISFPPEERAQVISFAKRFAARLNSTAPAVADRTAERSTAHQLLDQEMDAEEKAASASLATGSAAEDKQA